MNLLTNQVSGESGGEVELSLRWKHPYHIRHDATPQTSGSKQPAVKPTLSVPEIKAESKVKKCIADVRKEQAVTDTTPTHVDDPSVNVVNLKSESKTSLGGQSSSSTILSESEETTPVVSEGSQVSLTEPATSTVVPAPQQTIADRDSDKSSRVNERSKGLSHLRNKKAVSLTSSSSSKAKKKVSFPLKNSLPPLITKVTTPVLENQPQSDKSGSQEPSHVRKEVADVSSVQQTLADTSSSDLVDVTDSEMSLMSGLNLNTTGDAIKHRTTDLNKKSANEGKSGHKFVTTNDISDDGPASSAGERSEGGESGDSEGVTGDAGEGGGAGETDDSVSVTVTELSGDEVEEDLDGTGEDTMFEETPHQSGMPLL